MRLRVVERKREKLNECMTQAENVSAAVLIEGG